MLISMDTLEMEALVGSNVAFRTFSVCPVAFLLLPRLQIGAHAAHRYLDVKKKKINGPCLLICTIKSLWLKCV